MNFFTRNRNTHLKSQHMAGSGKSIRSSRSSSGTFETVLGYTRLVSKGKEKGRRKGMNE